MHTAGASRGRRRSACDVTFEAMEFITANAMFSRFSPRPIRLVTSDSAKTVHIELIEVPEPFLAISHRSSGLTDKVLAMADGSLYNGDLLVVDCAEKPRHGDIVVASVQGELLSNGCC